MAYDDLKTHDGRRYTGMPVGGTHEWIYPDGLWREEKVAPDRWAFTYDGLKERTAPAPQGSGARVGTRYHWYVLADQRVKKLDKDTYRTRMEGLKFKVGHRRPHWRDWSYGYDDQPSRRERTIAILEAVLAELKGEADGKGRADGADGGRAKSPPR